MRRTPVAMAAGLAAAGVIASAVTAGATGGGGPVAQNILGSASETTETMMAYLDYGYIYSTGFGFNTAGGCQQLGTSPTPQWLDFSCADATKGDIDRTVTDGVTTAGSNVITSATANFDCEGGVGCPGANRDQGRGVTGVGIPVGSYINKIDSATQAELNNTTTATASGVTLNINRIVTDNYRHDQVHGAFFFSTGFTDDCCFHSYGAAQLCSQGSPGVASVDYIRSAIAATPGTCTHMHFVAYARDAISWEAFNIAGSGVATMNNTTAPCAGGICLTQVQLKAIYVNCTITNWSQVGGPNIPISIYTPLSGSETRITFEAFLGGNSSACIPAALQPAHQIPENSNVGIPASDRQGAIFPFSFGVWSNTVNGAGGAVLGQIDGVAPTTTTVQSGMYPWGRFLYNVYCVNTGVAGDCPVSASQATVDYIGEHGWICKNLNEHAYAFNGANYHYVVASKITAAGFVPLAYGPMGGGDPGSDYCRLTIS